MRVSEHKKDDARGKRLVSMLDSCGMVIGNGVVGGEGKCTWFRDGLATLIDLVVFDEREIRSGKAREVRVVSMRDSVVNTDHDMVLSVSQVEPLEEGEGGTGEGVKNSAWRYQEEEEEVEG